MIFKTLTLDSKYLTHLLILYTVHPSDMNTLRFWSLFPRTHVQEQIKRAELQFWSLPQHHQNLLPDVLSNLACISQCADKNQELLQAIVHNSLHMFENIEYGERVRLNLKLHVMYCTYAVMNDGM